MISDETRERRWQAYKKIENDRLKKALREIQDAETDGDLDEGIVSFFDAFKDIKDRLEE